jgi:hypothetical protein
VPRSLALLCALLLLSFVSACGSGGSDDPYVPFEAQFPDEGPGGSPTPPSLPPPAFPRTPVWTEDAFPFERVATFGSFPSDMDRFGATFFVTDADAVESDGALVVAIDASGATPAPSTRYSDTLVRAEDLVDSAGTPGDASAPIGFGAFLNDVRVVADDLGFVLASAGGSDSSPALSNLVVFDPTTGLVRQVVDLANEVTGTVALYDSAGTRVTGDRFRQSGAEGVEYVPTSGGRGVLFVAMSNLLFDTPSFGAVKLPGTVQVFDVDPTATSPVSARPQAGAATLTLFTRDHNPVALSHVEGAFGRDLLLVTVAGTTGFDAGWNLVPVTPASVEVFDASTLALLGRFELGLVGLSAIRPAIGEDGAGHFVAFFASSVLGEVYLLRLDGLRELLLDPDDVEVLRGPNNPIPIQTSLAGGPGGNVAGIALSGDGRTLVVSGFGDFFAFPAPRPGRLFALSLPADLRTGSGFTNDFVPGTANIATTSGRALGPCAVAALHPDGPEVFVLVSGSLSTETFLGTGPGSLGTLTTFGRIR